MLLNRYSPLKFDFVEVPMFVARFVISTRASGNAAPVASVMAPTRLPSVAWPSSVSAQTHSPMAAKNKTRGRFKDEPAPDVWAPAACKEVVDLLDICRARCIWISCFVDLSKQAVTTSWLSSGFVL